MKTFLISAYACEPGEGSEPGVGWNWTLELTKNNKVILLTRKNNKEKINQVLKKQNNENLEIYYCDIPKHLSFWKKGQRGLHLYYALWQYYSYRLAKTIVKSKNIDYCCSLTFGNMWLPTFMYRLSPKFIWGPLGGGEGVPKILWNKISRKQRIFEIVREINKKIPITNPWFYSTCKNAHLIIVRTEDSLKCIPQPYRNRCKTMIETGVSEEDIENFAGIRINYNINYSKDFIVVGRMVPYKLIPLAIEAFSRISSKYSESKLHIIGDGPDKDIIRKLIIKYELQDRVILHGNLVRSRTLEIMAASRGLILPSAREGGSWVMFEAMLLKKPIICFNTSGMAVVINDSCGIKIDLCKYEEAINKFASAIELLINNDQKCKELGEEGYQRVSTHFTWSKKIDILLDSIN